jgi:hypothetical protein
MKMEVLMHSFLMIGQSNMAGRGRLEEVPPIENGKLFMLRNGRWWPLTEPVNYDRPFAGTGLAPQFADLYSGEWGIETGLIPCADGGTSLEDWKVGGQLYDHAVGQTRLAQRISEVKGILWHQGENDSGKEADALSYVPRFLHILSSLRRDCHLEHVPVILGELGAFLSEDTEGHRYFYLVNKALREIAAGNAGIGLASSGGLVSNGDHLHFNAASLREFGLRYYQKFREITMNETRLF